MAANKVFAVVELLESILLWLETKEILLSQEVSKTFRDTISGSIPLQRALFMFPGEVENINEGLHGYHGARFTIVTSQKSTTTPAVSAGVQIIFNPLLISDVTFKYHSGLSIANYIGYLNGGLLMAETAHSSCNRMFITQPPLHFKTTSLRVGLVNIRSLAPLNCRVSIRPKQLSQGKKFGELRKGYGKEGIEEMRRARHGHLLNGVYEWKLHSVEK